MSQQIKNVFKLFTIKRNEAIYTCLKNDIPLTDKNIQEIEEILKHKEKNKLLLEIKKREKK